VLSNSGNMTHVFPPVGFLGAARDGLKVVETENVVQMCEIKNRKTKGMMLMHDLTDREVSDSKDCIVV